MTYRDVVLADNPSHYWEVGGGDTVCIVHDLVVGGLPLLQTTTVRPGFSGAWDGGLSCHVSPIQQLQSDNAIAQAAPFSAEVWGWPFLTSSIVELFCGDGVTANTWSISLDGTRKPRFTSGGILLLGPNPMVPYTWQHLVLTYAGGLLTGYANGVAVGSLGGGNALGSPVVYSVGALGNATAGYHGFLGHFATYPSALSAARVAAHFAAADDRTINPLFMGGPGAVFDAGGGIATGDVSSILQQILKAVKRNF